MFVSEDIRLFYRDAAAYDAAYEGGGDLPFWAEACRRYQPRSVLELAVGTGRVAVPLARQGVEQGFAVTGVDVTPEMLTFAREKLAAEPPAVQAKELGTCWPAARSSILTTRDRSTATGASTQKPAE